MHEYGVCVCVHVCYTAEMWRWTMCLGVSSRWSHFIQEFHLKVLAELKQNKVNFFQLHSALCGFCTVSHLRSQGTDFLPVWHSKHQDPQLGTSYGYSGWEQQGRRGEWSPGGHRTVRRELRQPDQRGPCSQITPGHLLCLSFVPSALSTHILMSFSVVCKIHSKHSMGSVLHTLISARLPTFIFRV